MWISLTTKACLTVKLFICLLSSLYVMTSVGQSNGKFVCPLVLWSFRQLVALSVRPSVRPSVRASVRSFVRSSVRSFVRPFVRSFVRRCPCRCRRPRLDQTRPHGRFYFVFWHTPNPRILFVMIFMRSSGRTLLANRIRDWKFLLGLAASRL